MTLCNVFLYEVILGHFYLQEQIFFARVSVCLYILGDKIAEGHFWQKIQENWLNIGHATTGGHKINVREFPMQIFKARHTYFWVLDPRNYQR